MFYVYSGCTATANGLAELLKEPVLTDAARRAALETYLGLLRHDGDGFRATDYVLSLAEWLVEQPETAPSGSMGPEDLPSPPEAQ